MKILDSTKRRYIKNIKKIVTHINECTINKVLKQEIYRNIQKRKQNKINNELIKLKFNILTNKNNINQDDLVKIKQYNTLNLKTLQKIAQQRNINTTRLKKKNLIYT